MTTIDLFCGINSAGVPYTRENKNHIGYFDIVKEKLIEDGYNVNGINISSFSKNCTWDLEKALHLDYSLCKIKNMQRYSIDKLRNTNLLFKLVIPKNFQKRYVPNIDDDKVTFKDIYINSENPIFIYSGGPNDFFSYIQAGPVELMNKDVREKLPNNLNELVTKCVNNVEQNLILLNELNKEVTIYVLSFYYSPLFDKIQKVIYLQEKINNKEKKYNNKFWEIINLYNSQLEEMCQKYDFVEYIDINFIRDNCATMDFHPNKIGNELIANELLKKIQFRKQNSDIKER